MTLQRRVFLSFAGLVLALVSAVTAVSVGLSMRAAEDEIARHLDDALVTYSRYEQQRGELLSIQARAMASAPHLKATFEIPDVDRDTIAYAVSALSEIADTDVLAVLDPAGALVVDVGRTRLAGGARQWPQRARALAGDSFASTIVDAGRAIHVAVAPIESGGRLLGVLLVGIRLDTVETLRLAQEVTGVRFAMSVNGRVFPADDEVRALFGRESAALPVLAPATPGRRSDAGHSYLVRKQTLQNGRLHFLFFRDTDDVDSSIVDLQASLLALAAAAVVGGLLLARSLTAQVLVPIRHLTSAAEALGAGDLSVRVPSGSADEVGALARTFNAMANQLSTQQLRLVDSLDAAEAASREKSAFLARMSHEIRTPLNGMLGVAEILRLDTNLGRAHRDYLSMLHSSGVSLLQIVNDVLDVSKIEAGQVQLDPVPFDLAEIVGACLDLYEPTADRLGVELLGDIAPDMAREFVGDASRLRQVLSNLLGNALKFTPAGRVLVRVDAKPRGDKRAWIRMSVEDTGIGIRADMLDKIFESFQQEDGSTTRRYGGTGLGLSICRQLMSLMGGSISVQSEQGRGSCFVVEIELALVAGTRATVEVQSLTDCHLHVLSNSRDYEQIIERVFVAAGADVTLHASEASALAVLTQYSTRAHRILVLDGGAGTQSNAALNRLLHDQPRRAHLDCVVVVVGQGQEAAPAEAVLWLRQRANLLALYARVVQLMDIANVAEPSHAQLRTDPMRADGVADCSIAGLHVLLVEDSVVNQAVAEGMLSLLGCSVEIAEDGLDAVERVFESRFDAVLMDCQMPRMDGLQATREIRRIETQRELPRMPIVALTANVYREDRERCLAAGMDHYVGKPFTPAEISHALVVAIRAKVGPTSAGRSPHNVG